MKTFYRLLIIGLILFFFADITQAQYENTSNQVQQQQVVKKPKVNKWFAGGMLGAGFSSYSAYVSVEPLVGYNITPAFQVGARFTYIFNSYKIYNGFQDVTYNLNSYGVGIFTRYIIYKGIMAQVEYETLNLEYISYSYQELRMWVPSLFIGGGYIQSMGGRGFASFAILWNVIENEYSPYVNPLIRIGFGVNF
ncbi:MAG TPA: hypothetical protein VIN10_09445 [Bacteroidales bacterium]